MRAVLGLVLFALLWGHPATAHELRPGFLEITEIGPARYEVRFKVPARGDLRLRMHPRFPADCADAEDARTEHSGDAFIDRFIVACPSGLADREIVIDGLGRTFTDVVTRVALADGSVQTVRLTPDQPYFTIAPRRAGWKRRALTFCLACSTYWRVSTI